MTSRVEAVAEILWHRYSPDHEDSWPSPNADEYRRVASDILSALTTEPAAPEGWREAARIGDAVLDWMVKDDLLDGGNEYYVADVLAVLNDPTLPTRPSEQAVTATHRHKNRGTEYVLIGIGKMQSDNWQVSQGGFDQAIDMQEVTIYRSVDDGSLWVRPREEFEDGRFIALKAAMEAGRHD